MPRTDQREYTPQEITRALLAMVNAGGSAKEAQGALASDPDEPINIPAATLRAWKADRHRDEYRRLDVKHGGEVEDEAVRLQRDNMLRAAELESKLIRQMEEKVKGGRMDAKDLAAAIRSIADLRAKSVDKVLSMTGRPTDGNDLPDGAAVLKALVAKGILVPVGPAAEKVLNGGEPSQEPVDGTVVEDGNGDGGAA